MIDLVGVPYRLRQLIRGLINPSRNPYRNPYGSRPMVSGVPRRPFSCSAGRLRRIPVNPVCGTNLALIGPVRARHRHSYVTFADGSCPRLIAGSAPWLRGRVRDPAHVRSSRNRFPVFVHADVGEDARAGVVGWKGLQAELGDQAQHLRLCLAHPLPAHLDSHAVAQRVADGATAHPIAGLEHSNRVTRGGHMARRSQTDESAAHTRDINVGTTQHQPDCQLGESVESRVNAANRAAVRCPVRANRVPSVDQPSQPTHSDTENASMSSREWYGPLSGRPLSTI